MLQSLYSEYTTPPFQSPIFKSLWYASNRKAMYRNWRNQKANPALKTKTGNKYILQIDKIQ